MQLWVHVRSNQEFCMLGGHDKFCALQVLEYLEAYTEHFGFGKNIIFRTEVVSVLPSLKGGFTVSTKVTQAP